MKLAEWLRYSGPYDPQAARVADRLITTPSSLDSFSTAGMSPVTAGYVDYFAQSVISYNFTFDMSEINNIDASVDFLKVFPKSTDTAALSGGFDRTRQNVRTFTVSDSFHRIVYELGNGYCEIPPNGKNYIYPITGTIGINEMIDTFVDLALFGGLAPGKAGGSGDANDAMASANTPKTAVAKKNKAAAQTDTAVGPLAMGDTLAFTTKLTGTVSPKFVVAPITSGLADASFTATGTRTDVHRVIVGMSVPTSYTPGKSAGSITQIASPTGKTPLDRSLEMIAQQILRFERPSLTSSLLLAQ